MKRIWQWIHRFLENDFAQGCLGLFTLFCGAWELIHEMAEEGEVRFEVEWAVVIIGALQALAALANILDGFERVSKKFSRRAGRRGMWVLKITEHHLFQLVLGAVLFFAGLGEAWEDYRDMYSDRDEYVWQYGVILLGVVVVLRGLCGSMEALSHWRQTGSQSMAKAHHLERIYQCLTHPRVRLALALGLLSLVLVEIAFFEGRNMDPSLVEAHWGFGVYALNSAVRRAPTVFESLELVD